MPDVLLKESIMQTDKDYYQILQIEMSASEDEIRNSYRTLVRKYHPDVASDPKSAEKFKEIQEAYEILADPQQRRKYDGLREAEGQDKSSAISIRATISHKFLLTNIEEQAFYVLLEITPAIDLPTSRLPLNLCLVLDRSTQMQGMQF